MKSKTRTHTFQAHVPGKNRRLQFNVTDVLVQHLDVLLVVERHPSAGFSCIHLQGGEGARLVMCFARNGLK